MIYQGQSSQEASDFSSQSSGQGGDRGSRIEANADSRLVADFKSERQDRKSKCSMEADPKHCLPEIADRTDAGSCIRRQSEELDQIKRNDQQSLERIWRRKRGYKIELEGFEELASKPSSQENKQQSRRYGAQQSSGQFLGKRSADRSLDSPVLKSLDSHLALDDATPNLKVDQKRKYQQPIKKVLSKAVNTQQHEDLLAIPSNFEEIRDHIPLDNLSENEQEIREIKFEQEICKNKFEKPEIEGVASEIESNTTSVYFQTEAPVTCISILKSTTGTVTQESKNRVAFLYHQSYLNLQLNKTKGCLEQLAKVELNRKKFILCRVEFMGNSHFIECSGYYTYSVGFWPNNELFSNEESIYHTFKVEKKKGGRPPKPKLISLTTNLLLFHRGGLFLSVSEPSLGLSFSRVLFKSSASKTAQSFDCYNVSNKDNEINLFVLTLEGHVLMYSGSKILGFDTDSSNPENRTESQKKKELKLAEQEVDDADYSYTCLKCWDTNQRLIVSSIDRNSKSCYLIFNDCVSLKRKQRAVLPPLDSKPIEDLRLFSHHSFLLALTRYSYRLVEYRSDRVNVLASKNFSAQNNCLIGCTTFSKNFTGFVRFCLYGSLGNSQPSLQSDRGEQPMTEYGFFRTVTIKVY